MKTNIKNSTLIIFAFLAIGIIPGCTSSTDAPSNTTTVNFTGETDGSLAGAAAWKSQIPLAGIPADSIEVTRVRFLLSAVKLHVEGNDTTNDKVMKAGPFVAEFIPGLSRTFSTIVIPSGTYEKIKLEIHKFPSSIDQNYLNDPVFTDFVTGERSTVIIEGKVWPTNISVPVNFIYKSQITANVESKFPGLISLGVGTTNTIALQFSPMLAFKSTFVLDPRDSQNSNDIDKFLKSALKSIKK